MKPRAELCDVVRVICGVVALGLSGTAGAMPADVLIVLDSSASMSQPWGDGTRLEAAKSLIAQIAKAAAGKHRVGLVRYAQLEPTVPGGEGKHRVHAADPKDCERAADLLVPLGPAASSAVARYVDGLDLPGNPEVVSLGDSPLLGTMSVSIDYLRARRRATPKLACVNAVVVVITDGGDSCVASGALQSGLTALAQTGAAEDIQALVVSFDPTSSSSKALAAMGPKPLAPFGMDKASEVVAWVAALEGRLAPEACLVSGVKPAQIGLGSGGGDPFGLKTDGSGTASPATTNSPTDSGCSMANSTHRQGLAVLALLLLAAALLARTGRRSRSGIAAGLAIALVLTAATGCKKDPEVIAPDVATDTTASPSDTASPLGKGTLEDPGTTLTSALSIAAIGYDAIPKIREALAPTLVPAKAFAALAGDPVEACGALARSVAFEPYRGVQRGVTGCLATRRCNALEAAALVQACLQSKSVTSEVRACMTDVPKRKTLRARALATAPEPDVSQATALIDGVVAEVGQKSPPHAQAATGYGLKIPTFAAQDLGGTVADDLKALAPLRAQAEVSPVETDLQASGTVEDALAYHFVVVTGGTLVDPILAESPFTVGTCDPTPFDAKNETPTVTVTAEAVYVHLQGQELIDEPPIVLGTLTYAPGEVSGAEGTFAVVEAANTQVPAALPPESSTGCLRALLRVGDAVVIGKPFHIGPGDAAACPEASLATDEPARHLTRLTVRWTFAAPHDPVTVERVLVDRYGYASTDAAKFASGPTWGHETGRALLPMRVDWPVFAGLPTQALLLDRALASLATGRAAAEARMAKVLGVPQSETVSRPGMPPHPWAVLGVMARFSGAHLQKAQHLVAVRPWLLAVVQRRGWGEVKDKGLRLEPTLIFDVLDAPLVVVGPEGDDDAEHKARLDVQVALGVLVTEAERFAAAAWGHTFDAVNAGPMLRDAATGPWGAWGSTGHEAEKFPKSVANLAASLGAKNDLFVTPGDVPFLDGSFIAWWRINHKYGATLGEVRYDGTFYGQSTAGFNYFMDVEKCIWTAATAALVGEYCDVMECAKEKAKEAMLSALQDAAFGGLFSISDGVNLGNFAAAVLSLGEETAAAGEAVGAISNINELIGNFAKPAGCYKAGGGK